MKGIPIIKVELEGIRQAMHHAFTEQQLQLDEMFQEALDEALDPKEVKHRVLSAARAKVNEVVNQAVDEFLSPEGPGGALLREMAGAILDEQFKLYQEEK